MLTIFSCPKPFTNPHINIIQRNAIKSWTLLQPRPDIILIGDEEGTVEICKEFGLHHIPEVKRNEYGTPLVNSLFSIAENAASNSTLCYVNADILLMSDFLQAIQRALREKPSSLLVGRRWDLDVCEPLNFSNHWEAMLKNLVFQMGKLHAHTGIDYFVFPKGLFGRIPPFAIGRSAWDNWLLYRAWSQNVPVIDLTEVTTVVHQNHDYSHHPEREQGVWKGKEAVYNLTLAGGYTYAFTLKDAQYKLTQKGLRRNLTPYYIYRVLVILSTSYPFLEPLVKVMRSIYGLVIRRQR